MGHPSLSQDPAHFAPGTPGDQAEDAVEFASKRHKKASTCCPWEWWWTHSTGPCTTPARHGVRHANVTGARDVMSGIARNCSDSQHLPRLGHAGAQGG